MPEEMSAVTKADGGGREWPMGLVDLVYEYGFLPLRETVSEDDYDESTLSSLSQIYEKAGEIGASPNEMLLNLKRINSVIDGIPSEDDVRDWDGGFSVRDYDRVFGSVENAVEFAVAASAGDLTLAIGAEQREA